MPILVSSTGNTVNDNKDTNQGSDSTKEPDKETQDNNTVTETKEDGTVMDVLRYLFHKNLQKESLLIMVLFYLYILHNHLNKLHMFYRQ